MWVRSRSRASLVFRPQGLDLPVDNPRQVKFDRKPRYKPSMVAARFPILFITSSRIGDAVLSSGLGETAGGRDSRTPAFTIVADPLTLPLFRDTPGLEKLIPLVKAALRPALVPAVGDGAQAAMGAWWWICAAPGLARLLRARRRAVRRSLPPGRRAYPQGDRGREGA